MICVYCGICDQEFNFAGTTEYPEIWIEKHVALHERRFRDTSEDIEELRRKKPLHSKADIVNKAIKMLQNEDSK